MRLALAAALLTIGCSNPGAKQETSPASGISALGWIAGDWIGDHGSGSVEEHWTPPAGGTMLGTGRTLEHGRTLFFEFLRIEERGDDLFYVASPGGKGTTAFKMVRNENREAVFENPEHDWPVRILYRLEPGGSLFARVEGRDGKGEDFRMRRAK